MERPTVERAYKLKPDVIERQRLYLRLSTKQLADAADVNISTLNRWLHQGQKPFLRNITKLAIALKLPPQDIAEGLGSPTRTVATITRHHDDAAITLEFQAKITVKSGAEVPRLKEILKHLKAIFPDGDVKTLPIIGGIATIVLTTTKAKLAAAQSAGLKANIQQLGLNLLGRNQSPARRPY